MLLILGFDGATFDLVEPWVADGTLPHLAALMRRGAHGRLESTVPPATLPSWTTFMTGVNPGRHAIFDFTRRDPGSYRIRFVNGTFRKAPSIWKLLSAAGRRVCVLGLPGTYPPERINGCMISGFDTPVTTRADASFVYPSALAAEVEALGGFPFADFQEFDIGPGWHARALESLLSGIERKGRLAERWLKREPWDCFMLLMGESDTVAHHFWAFHDHLSPRFTGESPFAGAIRSVYVALDALLGRLMHCVPEAQVLVVSDHGFGGAGNTALYLNRWLAARGYLSWRGGGTGARMMRGVRQLAVRLIPEEWQARCFRLANGRLANELETRVRFGGIDWTATRAFSEELNYFPSIWLNVEGREPHGQISPGEYDRVCTALTEELRAWQDPASGEPVVRDVWRRDEIYHGPFVSSAPDLILNLATPRGYSYVCLSSGGAGEGAIEYLDPALTAGKLRGMSGSHRPQGLFALAGDDIMPGRVQRAWIGDLAPTILSLSGVVVPEGWDGRLLSCLRHSAGASPATPESPEVSESPYAPEEEKCLTERLVRLGYLE